LGERSSRLPSSNRRRRRAASIREDWSPEQIAVWLKRTLRQDLAKRTDLRRFSLRDLDDIVRRINTRPRRELDWATSRRAVLAARPRGVRPVSRSPTGRYHRAVYLVLMTAASTTPADPDLVETSAPVQKDDAMADDSTTIELSRSELRELVGYRDGRPPGSRSETCRTQREHTAHTALPRLRGDGRVPAAGIGHSPRGRSRPRAVCGECCPRRSLCHQNQSGSRVA
jgi:hypothetical protein